MTEQERLKMLQQQERARAAAKFPRSQGPKPGSVLSGRRGVVDSTPLEQLTPEQRRAVDQTPFQPGMPRLPKSGMNVWDQRLNDGAGGYAPRAPDMSQFDEFADQFPRIPLRPEARAEEIQGMAPPEVMAKSFGIDAGAYGPEAKGQLEADVAATRQRHDRLTKNGKYTVEQVPGGGFRYRPGAQLIAEQEARKRHSALQTLASRFQREMNADRDGDGRPDFTIADLQAAYDDPANQGKSHQERMLAVNNGIVNQFRTDRAMNIQQAIEQRAKQDNMARRLGTSRANVMFHDDLANAQTPEDRIRVLLAYHAQNPNLGLGNMAAYTQRGQDEARAMEAMERRQAEQARLANPVLNGPQDQAFIESLPMGSGRMEARRNAAKKGYPGGAAPPDAVHDAIINGEVDNVRSLIGKKGLTADESAHLREWTTAFLQRNHKGATSRAAFEAWSKMLGVTPWSPQSERLWRLATGQNIQEQNNPLIPDSVHYAIWGNDPRQLPDSGAQ